MTSYYKNFHKKLSPLSKFRYPNKMSVEELNRYVDEFGFYKDEFNIETVTFELKSLTDTYSVIIDFKNYIGDRSEIKDKFFDFTKEYLTSEDVGMLDEELENIPHWTVTFNTYEKWGVHKTQPYVELTPSKEFSRKRKDRNRIIIIEDNEDIDGDFRTLNNCELKDVDEQSGTPICLIDSETYYSSKYKHSKENIIKNIQSEFEEFISKIKVSNVDNLKDLKGELVVSLDNHFSN